MTRLTRSAFPAAAAILTLSAAVALAGPVSAGPAHPGRPAAALAGAAARPVSAAVRRPAAGYWTAARMRGATPLRGASQHAGGRVTVSPRAGSLRASHPSPPPHTPSPVHFNGIRTVGALFFTAGHENHFCTASVVDSPRQDVVLTAAHCVYGKSGAAANVAYVPQWHAGVSPYGQWPVTRITVARGWVHGEHPDLDFAFLTVAPPAGTSRPVQAVTGGLRLATGAGYDHRIDVIGYNNAGYTPIRCATASFEFRPDQQQFYCYGFWDGTSGGPWITGLDAATGAGTVVGDIGGYEQGGDYRWTSYSVYYGQAIRSLLASAGG